MECSLRSRALAPRSVCIPSISWHGPMPGLAPLKVFRLAVVDDDSGGKGMGRQRFHRTPLLAQLKGKAGMEGGS